MLLLLVGTIVLWVLWFLIGRTALAAAGVSSDPETENFELIVLLGAFVLAVVSQASHFFVPLPSAQSAVALTVTLVLLSVTRVRDLQWILQQAVHAVRQHSRLTALFLVILVLIAFSAARPCKIEDTENYHAQILRWTESARLVPGLALVHGRLGFNSLWFPLEAVLSFAFLSNGPLPLVNTSIFTLGLLYLFRQSFADDGSALRTNLALAAAVPYVVLGFLYAGSQSPDLPALTYGLLCFFAVFDAFASRQSIQYLLAICLAVAAACWKLSTASLLLFVPLLIWDAATRSRVRWDRRSLLVTAFLMVAGLCLIARSVVLSGYPFYPSTMIDVFPVDWKAPWIAHGQEIWIQLFARGLRTPESLSYPIAQWLPLWIGNWNMSARICLSMLAVGLMLFPVSLLFQPTRQWMTMGNRRALTAMAAVAVAASVFWFLEAPDVRFGASYLTALLALLYLPWVWPLGDRPTTRRQAAVVVWVAAAAAVGHNLVWGESVPPWASIDYARLNARPLHWLMPAPYPEASFREERLRDGSINHVVIAGGLAHYGPVPNSPLPIAGIAVRRGPHLSDGYRVDVEQ